MAGSATRVPCEPAHERNQVSSLGHREPGDNVLLAAKASDVAQQLVGRHGGGFLRGAGAEAIVEWSLLSWQRLRR